MKEKNHIIGLLISNPADRRLLTDFMVSLDYEVYLPKSSEATLQGWEKVSLILADRIHAHRYQEALTRLKRRTTFTFLPLIVILPKKAEAETWLRAGFDDVWRLPLTRAELQARLRVFLRLHEQSEQLYRTMIENSLIGFYRTTPDGRILYANPALVRMMGFSCLEELLQRNLEKEGFAPDYPRSIFKEYIEKHGQVAGLESAWIRSDGTMLFVRESARAIRDETGQIICYEGTVEDISERKRAEEAYRTLVEHSLQGLVIVQDFRIVFANTAFTEITGYTIDELLALSPEKVRALVHPEDQALVWGRFRDRLQGKPVPAHYEYRGIRKDGQICWLEMFASLIQYQGKPAVQGAIIDITERKQAIEWLRLLSSAVEQSSEGIAVADLNEKLLFVNQAFASMHGYTPEELVGKHLSIFHTPEQMPLVEASVRQVQETGVFSGELGHVRRDGTTFPTWMHNSLLRDEANNPIGMIGTVRDLTEHKRAEEEKKKLEAQLHQSQKLEAIGALAGGVAHDFNNLLTAITGYTELLLGELAANDRRRSDLEEIKKAANRATSLTRQLLAFSRRQPIQPKVLDLNDLVANMDKMLRRLISEDIELVTVLEPTLRRIKADPGQIEQVILNLVVNARDAMPQGGKLTIKTQTVVLNKNHCNLMPEARPGKFVCLSITDTGLGMDKATLEQIFEPFFTTKGPGQGTGLGLSVVYGIVKQHDGWITVDSQPGQGSTFKVYLPTFSIAPAEQPEKTILLQELQGSGERILLVEDEQVIREFTSRVLRANGYIVFTATTAEEALEVFERENREFHLVFSDMILPDKTGLQLVEQLRSHKSDLRVLLSSGYTDQKSQWPVVQEKGFSFLQKPYVLPDLLQTVKKVIRPN